MKQAKSRKQEDRNLSEDEILNLLLAKKTKSIDPNRVFFTGTAQNGENIYRLAGKKLTPTQASLLKGEAQMLSHMQLWKIFTETLRNEAHLRMWEKMLSLEDSHYGKTLLHAISIFETIVEKLQNIAIEPQKPHAYGSKPTLSPHEM